jgi:hypothetical protein
VRVVLRDNKATGEVLLAARRAIEVELDHLGAIVEALTILPVDEIQRVGTGAKERLVASPEDNAMSHTASS